METSGERRGGGEGSARSSIISRGARNPKGFALGLTRPQPCVNTGAPALPPPEPSRFPPAEGMSPALSPRHRHARLLPILLLVGLAASLGCLEAGDTPLGAEHGMAAIPEDAVIFELTGEALGLRVTRLEESRPLFATEVLYCGFDAASGFRSEPVFRFDCSALDTFVAGIETASLLPTFPAANADSLWLDDNPDLGRTVMVRVWRLPDLDFEDEVITGLAAIPEAWPVTDLPVALESSASVPLPPDSVKAWILDAAVVNLALGYEDALSEPGLLRLYSTRSSSTPTVLQIEPVSSAEETQSIEPTLDGQLADKLDTGAEFSDRLLLATGVTRDVHLIFNLPDSLRDPGIILVRAILELGPDTSATVGMGPVDQRDNDYGGLFLDEGGLTLQLQAVDDSLPGSAGIEAGRLLETRLSVFEKHITYDDPPNTDLQLTATRLTTPLRLPLTDWLQDWMNGADENAGLTLRLNGAEERLRQVAYFLHASAPHDSLAPRLELIYVRRPDFD